MQAKLFFAAIATHLLTPLPAHAVNALLVTLLGLALRTAFAWFKGTPFPINRWREQFTRKVSGFAFNSSRANSGLRA